MSHEKVAITFGRELIAIYDNESINTRMALDSNGTGLPVPLSTSIEFVLAWWHQYIGIDDWVNNRSQNDWVKVWPVEEQSFIVSGSSPKPRKEWQPDEISPDVDVMDVTRGLLG